MSNLGNTMSEEIELESIEVEHHRVMGEHLIELRKNKSFQAVIMEGYLKEKVLASVSLLGVPQISETGKRPGVMEDLVSASNLQYFFQQVESFYEGTLNPILSDDEESELQNANTEGGIN